MGSHLSILVFISWPIGILSRKWLSVPIFWNIHSKLSSCSSEFYAFWIDSFIGWETSVWVFSFPCESSLSPAASVEESVFTPKFVLGNFVRNQLAEDSCIHFWVIFSISLGNSSIFAPVLQTLIHFDSVVWRTWDQVFRYLQYCSFCSCLFWLFVVFCVLEEFYCYFDRGFIKCVNCFEQYSHFNYVDSPNLGIRWSFHLPVSL